MLLELVVHGQDGMDEITTTTASWAASLENGQVREIEIAPEEIGLKRAKMAELKGADAEHNARAIERVLAGEKTAFRDIVVLNSAAALMVAGKAPTLRAGAEMAEHSIDSGKAAAALSTLSSNPSSTAWAYSTSPRLTTSHSKFLVCTWALSLAKETPGTVLIAIPVCAVNGSKNALRQEVSHTPP